jgi:hypothetical protein
MATKRWWGGRTSQTVGIAGDGAYPSGREGKPKGEPIGWHKHDTNSHHGGDIHSWRRSPDDKRFVIKGIYQQQLD